LRFHIVVSFLGCCHCPRRGQNALFASAHKQKLGFARKNRLFQPAFPGQAHAPGLRQQRLQLIELPLLVFADLVADDAANRCPANRPPRAAARQNRATNGAYAGTDRSAFVPL
jgi:hypothetical protein